MTSFGYSNTDFFGMINVNISKSLDVVKKNMIKAFATMGETSDKHTRDRKKSNAKRKKTLAKSLSIGLDAMGVILQILHALGVLQPLLELIHGVFAVIGGSVMQVLAPAIQNLAELLFSPEMMALWVLLGEIIGSMLTPIIKVFAVVLKALTPLLTLLANLLSGPLQFAVIIIAKVIGLLIIGGLFPLVLAIWLIGVAIAALIHAFTLLDGVNEIEEWNNMMFPIMGAMMSGATEIVMMASGGYIPPSSSGTVAIIGEGGEGEFVIPESKMGSIGNQDMLYATQDNGDKLDKLIQIMASQSRLR